MAVRKAVEDAFVVDGSRENVARLCQQALAKRPFSAATFSDVLHQARANYRTLTIWGEIVVTLTPEAGERTRIVAKASAGVDNLYAVFRSPTRTILSAFKENYSEAG